MTSVVERKPLRELVATDIAFQTEYWGRIKARDGCRALAFDFSTHGVEGDFLVLERPIGLNASVAYVPLGPESAPDESDRGAMIEALCTGLAPHLDSRAAFIRWDLPWACPYLTDAAEHRDSRDRTRPARPEARVRELRMNFGTATWPLRASPTDVLPRATILIDLTLSQEALLARMKPKTRYNIRLAHRRGVSVIQAPVSKLGAFFALAEETGKRNGFTAPAFEHLTALFRWAARGEREVEAVLLLAGEGADLLAGAIVLFSGHAVTYLYGASSSRRRSLMAPYAVQWEIIREGQRRGCLTYDMYGTAPIDVSEHHLRGVHRFKQGFGGRLFHRAGCWDYPLAKNLYAVYTAMELAAF